MFNLFAGIIGCTIGVVGCVISYFAYVEPSRKEKKRKENIIKIINTLTYSEAMTEETCAETGKKEKKVLCGIKNPKGLKRYGVKIIEFILFNENNLDKISLENITYSLLPYPYVRGNIIFGTSVNENHSATEEEVKKAKKYYNRIKVKIEHTEPDIPNEIILDKNEYTQIILEGLYHHSIIKDSKKY